MSNLPLYQTLDLNHSGVIEASAGTGKTYTIENLVLRILTEVPGEKSKHQTSNASNEEYTSLDKLLIVTYTEKAAGELRSRIRNRIEERIKELLDTNNTPPLQHLRQCLQSFDKASIFTIHGFCTYLLKQFPFETKSGWDMEMGDNYRLAEEGFDVLLRNQWKKYFLDNVKNKVESETSEPNPKSTGNADSLKHFFQGIEFDQSKNGMSQWREQLIEVTSQYIPEQGDRIHPNKEAYEQEESSKQKQELLDELRELSTFFQGNYIVDAYFNLKGKWGLTGSHINAKRKNFLQELSDQFVNSNSKTTDTLDAFMTWYPTISYSTFQKQQSLRVLFQFKGHDEEDIIQHLEQELHTHLNVPFRDVLKRCDLFFSKLTTHLYFINLPNDWKVYHRCIQDLKTHMQIQKEQKNLITYDDMILKVQQALAVPNSPLLEILQERYSFGIIDEFQDTNTLQWDIFKTLFSKSKLYLIGDPKQSIYSFQGSDLQVYYRATQELTSDKSAPNKLTPNASKGGKKYSLNHNYRSSNSMIQAYNTLFSQPDWFSGKTERSIPYQPVQCGRTSSSYQLQHISAADVPNEETMSPATPIILKDFSSLASEHPETPTFPKQKDPKVSSARQQELLEEWILAEITDLVPQHQISRYKLPVSPDSNTLRSVEYHDICILVSSHSEAKSISQSLSKKDIPHTRYKEKGLYQSKWCFHLLLVLKATLHPEDFTLQKRTSLTPYFRSWFENIQKDSSSNSNADKMFQRIETLLTHWNDLATKKQWSQLFHQLQYNTGLLESEVNDKVPFIHKQLFRNLFEKASHNGWELEQIIHYLSHLYYRNIPIAEDENQYEQSSATSQVQIMTFHASKGLEFPIVFIAGGHKRGKSYHSVTRYSRSSGGRDFWLQIPQEVTPNARDQQRIQLDDEERRLYYVALTRASFRMYIPLFHSTENPPSIQPSSSLKKKHVSPSERFISYNVWSAWKETQQKDSKLDTQIEAPLFSFSKTSIKNIEDTETSKKLLENDELPHKTQHWAHQSEWQPPSPLHHRLKPQTSYSHLVQSGLAMPYTSEYTSGYSSIPENPENGGRMEKEDTPTALSNTSSNNPLDSSWAILPKGSHTGSMLHDVFENIPFQKVWEADTLNELKLNSSILLEVRKHLQNYGLGYQYQEDVLSILWNTLHAALPDPYHTGSSLSSDSTIPPISPIYLGALTHYTPEIEFHFNFDSTGKILIPQSTQGYVLGFIDLVFCHEERYYILDWKSNFLNEYSLNTIWEDMKHHLYTTQSLLYAVAVHNWLQKTLPNYSYEKNFGGIYYIYLRGMKGVERSEGTNLNSTYRDMENPSIIQQGYNAYRPKEEDMERSFPIEIQREIQKILQAK